MRHFHQYQSRIAPVELAEATGLIIEADFVGAVVVVGGDGFAGGEGLSVQDRDSIVGKNVSNGVLTV